MNKEGRKERLDALLKIQKQKKKEEEEKRQITELLEVFPNKENLVVLRKEEWLKMEDTLIQSFPVASWGRIDWDKIDNKIELRSNDYIMIESILKEKGLNILEPVYFFFGDGPSPWLKTSLLKIFESLEDITWYKGDRYIYCDSPKFIIEFFHDDKITIGWY